MAEAHGGADSPGRSRHDHRRSRVLLSSARGSERLPERSGAPALRAAGDGGPPPARVAAARRRPGRRQLDALGPRGRHSRRADGRGVPIGGSRPPGLDGGRRGLRQAVPAALHERSLPPAGTDGRPDGLRRRATGGAAHQPHHGAAERLSRRLRAALSRPAHRAGEHQGVGDRLGPRGTGTRGRAGLRERARRAPVRGQCALPQRGPCVLGRSRVPDLLGRCRCAGAPDPVHHRPARPASQSRGLPRSASHLAGLARALSRSARGAHARLPVADVHGR